MANHACAVLIAAAGRVRLSDCLMIGNLTSSLPGVTSRAFHISLWLILSTGLVGNLLVILWRLCRKSESKWRLHSLLIICLATADFLFCLQFLLREILLLKPIFVHTSRFNFTTADERMCFATNFFTFVSCNTVLLTSLAIAMHSFLGLTRCPHEKHFVGVFVLVGWAATLALAAVTTRNLKLHDIQLDITDVSTDSFSLVVMFGCTGDLGFILFPVVVTSVNALSSILCSIFYGCVCLKIRRALRSSERDSTRGETKVHFPIRLAIVVLLNMVCWWPACIIYAE